MTNAPLPSVFTREPVSVFVATSDATRALAFYRDTLGLNLTQNDQFALTFDLNGVRLRVQIVAEVTVAPYTALGWEVDDVPAMAKRLGAAGVEMARFPGVDQDEAAVWTSPDGTRVAWFKDPEGHILSIDDSRHRRQ